MRVQLQNSAYFPHLGGIQSILAQMAHELRHRGHVPSILCRSDRGAAELGAWQGVPVARHPYTPPPGRRWLMAPLLNLRALKRHVAAFARDVDLLWPAHEEYALASAESLASVPMVYVVQHNTARMIGLNWHPETPRARLATALVTRQCAVIQKRALHRARAVVTWSDMTKRDMVACFGVNPDKIHVILPGPGFSNGAPVRDASLRTRLGVPAHARVVLCVCRLVRNKNVAMLIRALARVGVPDAHLVVVGDGPERPALERLVDGLGLGGRVRFAGAHQDVRPFYGIADVFAFPSLFEGFGIVLLEAMAAGLPCVALKADYPRVVTSSDEIIEHGETGFTVSPRSDEELAERIETLLRDGDLAAAMGARGRERYHGLFTWTRHVERLLAVSRALG